MSFYAKVSELSSQCNIPTDGGRSRRHGDDMDQDGDNTDATARNGRHGMFIPFGLVDDLFEFSGAFEYGILKCKVNALVHTHWYNLSLKIIVIMPL